MLDRWGAQAYGSGTGLPYFTFQRPDLTCSDPVSSALTDPGRVVVWPKATEQAELELVGLKRREALQRRRVPFDTVSVVVRARTSTWTRLVGHGT